MICTNLIWKSLCIRMMPISYPLLLITLDNKFQEIIIINVLELIMVKKCCNILVLLQF